MKNLTLLALAGLIACTAEPNAPGLEGDAGSAGDAAVAADAGRPPRDTGPDLLADAGSTDVPPLAQDVGGLPPGNYDAGFEPPEPPPPPHEEDHCAQACLGMPCGRECRAACNIALPAMTEDERPEYLACLNETSCEPWRCLPNREASEVCQQVCDNRALRQCDVTLSADEDVCGYECDGLLAMMSPPARQAWLQCTINECGTERRAVNCDPTTYLGPPPTQACINRGLVAVTCEPRRNRSAWEAAWECEGWRTPADQEGLGGNEMVECLGNAGCGGPDFYRCMIRSQEATGRGDEVAEACRHAERCEGLGAYCQLMANGLTRVMGQVGMERVNACLLAAEDSCDDIRTCIQGMWDPNQVEVEPLCRQACIGCNDPTEACIHACSRLHNSMSHSQADTYMECIRNRAAAEQCGDFLPATCIAPALPSVDATCRAYVNHMINRCPGTRFYNPEALVSWCSLSGVRSGLTNLETLTACVDRTGCAAPNLWEACTR